MQNKDELNKQQEKSSYDLSYDDKNGTQMDGRGFDDSTEMSMGSMEGTSDDMMPSSDAKNHKPMNILTDGAQSRIQRMGHHFKDRPMPYMIAAVGVGAALGAWLR